MREGISRVLRAAAVGSDDADILKAERWCSRMSQHKDTPKESRSVYFNAGDYFVVVHKSELVSIVPFSKKFKIRFITFAVFCTICTSAFACNSTAPQE